MKRALPPICYLIITLVTLADLAGAAQVYHLIVYREEL
jgi:hypothetical protein